MATVREDSPERLVSGARADEEQGFELKLRPRWLREFIGQSKAKEQLSIALEAAKSRGEPLDHVLLFGPPGLGKTTLATIIANEMDVGFQQTAGPAIAIQGDLTAILTNVREKQVLFLDEIHRLPAVFAEKLYTALEDYQLDIIIGQGPAARTHVMELRPFTFIGRNNATRSDPPPLRARFGILLRLEPYTEEELCRSLSSAPPRCCRFLLIEMEPQKLHCAPRYSPYRQSSAPPNPRLCASARLGHYRQGRCPRSPEVAWCGRPRIRRD